MTLMLLATALLALQPADARPTAGQMYEDCALFAAGRSAEGMRAARGLAMPCEISAAALHLLAMAEAIALQRGHGPDQRRFCPSRDVLDSGAVQPFIQAFTAHVDRNRASRDSDAEEVWERALEERWPCRR